MVGAVRKVVHLHQSLTSLKRQKTMHNTKAAQEWGLPPMAECLKSMDEHLGGCGLSW